jgi:RNA polymerase sigma factor (sigma-70 family)
VKGFRLGLCPAQQNGFEEDRSLWECLILRKICWARSSRCIASGSPTSWRLPRRLWGSGRARARPCRDAFASVVRSRRDFRREGPLEAWVWRAVINAARKKKRRYARDAQARMSVPALNGTAPDRLGSDLATLVAALPERQRLVLFLRYYADLDYLRIAQILGVRTGTVSASLHAAHKTLRHALEEAVER